MRSTNWQPILVQIWLIFLNPNFSEIWHILSIIKITRIDSNRKQDNHLIAWSPSIYDQNGSRFYFKTDIQNLDSWGLYSFYDHQVDIDFFKVSCTERFCPFSFLSMITLLVTSCEREELISVKQIGIIIRILKLNIPWNNFQ